MTEPTAVPSPPAGWYADPSGTAQLRWWDGSSWTEHVSTAAPQPYSVDAPAIPMVAAGTPVYTVFIWIVALLPLLSPLELLGINFQTVVQSSGSESAITSASLLTQPGYLIAQAASFAMYLLLVLFCLLDWRALKKAGYVRPFHWAWAFLYSGVYVIGRSIVVRRRAGRGLAPIWVWAAVLVVSTVVVFSIVISAIVTAVQTVPGVAT